MFIYSSAKVTHPHIDRPTPAVPGYTRPREDWTNPMLLKCLSISSENHTLDLEISPAPTQRD
jgi:hypothetical protein